MAIDEQSLIRELVDLEHQVQLRRDLLDKAAHIRQLQVELKAVQKQAEAKPEKKAPKPKKAKRR